MIKIEGLEPNKDTRIILGELYYTVSGAMKALDVGRNKIVNSIKDGTLAVLQHPSGNLFSEGALLDWVKKHTFNSKR